MSVTTFGPPVRIDGPLPLAPSYSLLDTVQVLNEGTAARVGPLLENVLGPAPLRGEVESADEFIARSDAYLSRLNELQRILLPEPPDNGEVYRWGNGAQVYPYPVDTGESFDPCSTGTFRVKNDGQTPPLPIFAAFTAYLPETCTSSRIVSPDYFRARAQLAFAAVESAIYEDVLATGGALNGSGQPYMGDSNLVVLGGGPVSPLEGLALLEDAIGATHRSGMIHVTPATLVSLMFFGEVIHTVGNSLASTYGDNVVVGNGYIGVIPDTHNAALTSTQAWAFATGPVQVRREPNIRIYPDELYQALDRAENIVTYRAERDALVTWDTVLQVGVLIDRSLS